MPSSNDLRRSPRPARQVARDRLGRPLPPGGGGGVGAAVAEPRSVVEAFDLAVEHFDRGRFFEAHECFEFIWRHGPADERAFWKGLTQVAAGLCHCQRENARGAVALLARGAGLLVRFRSPYRGVDVALLLLACREVAEALGREGASERLAFPRFPLA